MTRAEIALSRAPIFSSRPAARQPATESVSIKPAFSSTSAVTSKLMSGWKPPRKASGRWAIAEVLRTKTISEPRGFMKVLVAKDSNEILGFTGFAFEASELMVAMQTAMLGHLPYTVLRDAILTHPTMSEGLAQLLANVPPR